MSKFEDMRKDPANWTLGILYRCSDDPRVVVRNLLPFGWTWNFGHRKVYIAILSAIVAFLGPPYLAWQMGARSGLTIGIITVLALVSIVFIASRLARDPEH